MKKYLFACLICVMCFAENKTSNWINRIDFNSFFESHNKPYWFIETIQPIYQTSLTHENNLFFQGRASYKNKDETFNLGLGYRFLFPKQMWMIGANCFYDYKLEHNHQNYGFGFEVFNEYASCKSNFYRKISHEKNIGDGIVQKSLNGWDIGGKVPVIWLPWASLIGKYYKYNGSENINKQGYDLRVHFDFIDYLSLECGFNHDNCDSNKFVLISLRLGRPKRIQYTLSKNPYASNGFLPLKLKDFTLEKVKRGNQIILENTTSTNNKIIK